MSVSRQNKAVIMNSLENSLCSLMKVKQFGGFSIRELCKAAGVGRSSFYRYYASKEDVVISLLMRKWYAYCKLHNYQEKNLISFQSAVHFIHYYYEEREFFDVFYKNKLDRVYPMLFERYIRDENPLDNYRASFLGNGVYGMLKEWWECGFKEPPEVLIGVVENLYSER